MSRSAKASSVAIRGVATKAKESVSSASRQRRSRRGGGAGLRVASGVAQVIACRGYSLLWMLDLCSSFVGPLEKAIPLLARWSRGCRCASEGRAADAADADDADEAAAVVAEAEGDEDEAADETEETGAAEAEGEAEGEAGAACAAALSLVGFLVPSRIRISS